MDKKIYIALSTAAVVAVVAVGAFTQGNFLKGSFTPLSVVCTKPLSSPVSGVRGRGDALPVSGPSNPCIPSPREERTINKYISPQVPIEKKVEMQKVLRTR